MKSIEQLAQSAYAAYLKRVGGRAFLGMPVPSWEQLSPEHRECWIAAVQQLWAEFSALH